MKSIWRGVAWYAGRTGVGTRCVEPAGLGGGLQSGLAEVRLGGVRGEGDTTLGGSCVGTLGCPDIGIQGGQKDGGARSRHDLNMSQRLAMASTWETLVGGAAPVVNDSVLRRRGWDGKVGVGEFDCVRDDLAFGVSID